LVKRVLIIGGYGNFGGYIARALSVDSNVSLLIGGRSKAKADAFAGGLNASNAAQGCALDIDDDIAGQLAKIAPDIVVHTTGPFQSQDYRVARAAIAEGAHYLDLADARRFVAQIGELNDDAKAAGVVVISGASSVPCLTAAFIDHYRTYFARLDSVIYGITAAQATNRGVGTASAILSYVGKPFLAHRRHKTHRVFGWQGLHGVRYPGLGLRLFGDCDVPDLELFPRRYPEMSDLRFVAGHEVKLLHLATWLLSWFVRFGLVRSLAPYADRLLRLSFLFDPLGSDKSGFHMFLSGIAEDGRPKTIRIFMVARRGDGPNIPCMPAILLAKRLARSESIDPGARPCLDLIRLEELLAALTNLDVTTVVEGMDTETRH
jgi:hypothetical protein